jgi:hypothetical protein
MSYQTGVTFIEDLPELEDLEGPRHHQSAIRGNYHQSSYPGADMLPPGEANRYQKFIRKDNEAPHADSGMRTRELQSPQIAAPMEHSERNTMGPNITSRDSPSCLDVADHVENCPICSKIYKSDQTIYLIAIVVLAVISIILLKKVLDV